MRQQDDERDYSGLLLLAAFLAFALAAALTVEPKGGLTPPTETPCLSLIEPGNELLAGC